MGLFGVSGRSGSGSSTGRASLAVRRRFGRGSSASRTRRGSRPRVGNGSALEDSLVAQIKLAGLPSPERQARIVPGRRFAFDLCWPEYRLTCEVQGGEFLPKSAHTTGTGLRRDCLKQALALLQGYRTLTVTGSMVRDGEALELVESLLRLSGATCGPRT